MSDAPKSPEVGTTEVEVVQAVVAEGVAGQEETDLTSEALAQKKADEVAALKRETSGQTDAVKADVELDRSTQGSSTETSTTTSSSEGGKETWWGPILGGISSVAAKVKEVLGTLGKSISDGLAKLFGKKSEEATAQIPAQSQETSSDTPEKLQFALSELLVPDAPLFSFPTTWNGSDLSASVSDIRRIRPEHPVTHKKNVPHEGVDIPFPDGTPIVLTKKARVKKSTRGSNAGNYVTVEMENGRTASFMHLQKPGPEEGIELLPGQILGYVGNTGAGTGAHLHFEVDEGNEDPLPYLDAGIQASAQAKREVLEEEGKYVQLA